MMNKSTHLICCMRMMLTSWYIKIKGDTNHVIKNMKSYARALSSRIARKFVKLARNHEVYLYALIQCCNDFIVWPAFCQKDILNVLS